MVPVIAGLPRNLFYQGVVRAFTGAGTQPSLWVSLKGKDCAGRLRLAAAMTALMRLQEFSQRMAKPHQCEVA